MKENALKIQIISMEEKHPSRHYTYSSFVKPRSLDEYDINIINLNDKKLWYCNQHTFSGVNESNNLRSLGEMIYNSRTSTILYVFPQDIEVKLLENVMVDERGEHPQYRSIRLKDEMPAIREKVLSLIVKAYKKLEIVYENTITKGDGCTYNAAFYFNNNAEVLTLSDGSKKATTIGYGDRIILTTLDVLSSEDKTDHFIISLLFPDKREDAPQWMNEISFADDEEQYAIIDEQQKVIAQAEKAIQKARQKLEMNDRFKSILYTNGNELVEVVFEILEDLFEYDLSTFKDEKHEDFLIRQEEYTVIGEIKGVNSNVKNENLSQLELHCQKYRDKLQEEKRHESIKKILIINPFRKTAVKDREPVSVDQIELSNRYECLMVETVTLLKLFEMYKCGQITASDSRRLLTENIGLLRINNLR